MSMKGHTTEQHITTVEDGHNTADDGETHNDNCREIQMQQHSKLINLLEGEHILQIRESSGHEETAQPIFSRNILADCVQEHLRRNWDFVFWMWLMVVRTWIWLMVVRTRKTDDDN